ncbi:hypothetical protein GCM10009533_19870 [Saccharopolyspora spinosporotrichia]|uniref:Uncharacterized protein n=1 Tax=Saccharopolyspora erythraea TaxID=1836 RepID=A0ABN1CK63_SACER
MNIPMSRLSEDAEEVYGLAVSEAAAKLSAMHDRTGRPGSTRRKTSYRHDDLGCSPAGLTRKNKGRGAL